MSIQLRSVEHIGQQVSIIFIRSPRFWHEARFLGIMPLSESEDLDWVVPQCRSKYVGYSPLVDTTSHLLNCSVLLARSNQNLGINFDKTVDLDSAAQSSTRVLCELEQP